MNISVYRRENNQDICFFRWHSFLVNAWYVCMYACHTYSSARCSMTSLHIGRRAIPQPTQIWESRVRQKKSSSQSMRVHSRRANVRALFHPNARNIGSNEIIAQRVIATPWSRMTWISFQHGCYFKINDRQHVRFRCLTNIQGHHENAPRSVFSIIWRMNVVKCQTKEVNIPFDRRRARARDCRI